MMIGRKLGLATAAAAVVAMAQPAQAQLLGGVSNENIGEVLGGVGGALLGSQIGGGKGRLVGAAVGGVGGVILGGAIGRQLDARQSVGVAQTSVQALETGEATWTSADGEVSSSARVVETEWRPAPSAPGGLGLIAEVPPVELIGQPYRVTSNANLRGGPSTDYAVMGGLSQGETVDVVGRVVGTQWLLLERDGIGRGFLFENLAEPAGLSTADGERAASTGDLAGVRECSVLEQEIRTSGGEVERVTARACRGPDGAWVLL